MAIARLAAAHHRRVTGETMTRHRGHPDLNAIRDRSDTRRAGRTPDASAPSPEDDIASLISAVDALERELADTEETAADLRASAEIWARLYAANVTRANSAEAARDVLAIAVAAGPAHS